MAIYTIPCAPAGQAHWTQSTPLDGREYILTFRWSQRSGRWSLDVADEDGAAILSGRVLVPSMRVFKGVVDTRLPAGDLVLLDQRSAREGLDDPTFTSLGDRHVLVYLDGADLEAVREVTT